MNTLAPDEQKSTIDPTVDNLIKGEKGTQVFIPANALKFKDGTTPSGKVNIALKEFFSISDFVSNRLSTMSDSFLLETGGMLFISATADGKELVVDGDKSYTIAFPKSDNTKKMELFYGDSAGTENVNWQSSLPITEGFSFGYDSLLVDSTLYEYKTRVCGWRWMNVNEWGWKLNHPDSNIWNYVYKNLKLPDKLYKELCEMETYLDIELSINKNGKIYKTRFKEKISLELGEVISNFLKNLPPFDMRFAEFYYPEFEYELMLCCHKEFNQEKYAERFKQKYSQYKNKAIEKMDKGELGLYIFSVTKFGWINCDRFYYDENIEKIDYIVKAPDAKDAKVMIVFDSIRSIMNGQPGDDGFVFKNVPNSSKIKVIGISYKDGKPMLSKTSALINKQTFTLSGFKEFTLKELEKELNN